jgi:hypothetical protein
MHQRSFRCLDLFMELPAFLAADQCQNSQQPAQVGAFILSSFTFFRDMLAAYSWTTDPPESDG